jgi:hypothetical protein
MHSGLSPLRWLHAYICPDTTTTNLTLTLTHTHTHTHSPTHTPTHPHTQIASLLCFVLYATNKDDPHNTVNLYIACVLIFVVSLTSFMSYYQEGQSAKVCVCVCVYVYMCFSRPSCLTTKKDNLPR